MTPPLMRDFMRGDLLNKIRKVKGAAPHQHPALRAVEKRANGQINQCGPRLTEIEGGLLRDGDASIRRISEPGLEATNGVLGIDHRALRHGAWGQTHMPVGEAA